MKLVATELHDKNLSAMVVLNDKVAWSRFRCSTKPTHPPEAAEQLGTSARDVFDLRGRTEAFASDASHVVL